MVGVPWGVVVCGHMLSCQHLLAPGRGCGAGCGEHSARTLQSTRTPSLPAAARPSTHAHHTPHAHQRHAGRARRRAHACMQCLRTHAHARTHTRPRPPLTQPNAKRSLYNNIKTPGQLQPSATFYLFKEGIEPKWEDPRNINGGCWTANVPGRSKPQLDAWWLNSVSGRAGRVLGVVGGGRPPDETRRERPCTPLSFSHGAPTPRIPPQGAGVHRRAVHGGRRGVRRGGERARQGGPH